MNLRHLSVLVACTTLGACQDPAGGRGDSGATIGSAGSGSSGTDDGQGDGFGEETVYSLNIAADAAPPPLVLEMNRTEVAELFGDSAQEITLLQLDSTALLTNTLDEVRFACGAAWMFDDPDPHHDCSLTALGQSFMGPDGTWQTSTEYSMVRLLTMTPANVVVTGTSSEGLQEMADDMEQWGFTDGYSQILADALGISRTTPIVSTEAMVTTFQRDLLASHPNVPADGSLGFTLADALSDLATMTDRYGPVGDHPGVIDPSFPVQGTVLDPDFSMRAVASSNLRLAEGVGWTIGKGFLNVVVDTTGPTYEDELEFDFTDPESFSIEGIADDLRVDLRFRLLEHDGFVPACAGNNGCQNNLPGMPFDGSSVWARPQWIIEYALAAAARHDYQARVYAASYAFGAADVLIGQDGNPPGWVQYDIWFDMGNPPQDQYLWETVLEVGQVALHDNQYTSFAEGDANVAFTLFDVPVGISGPEAAEAVRPFLQEQAAAISDFLLGDYEKNNDRVDLFVRRAEDGELYAYFVTADDRFDGMPYDYAQPGFFHDPELQDRASSTAVVGLQDTTHEKILLTGDSTTVYYADETGEVVRARFFDIPADGSSVQVALATRP